MAGLDYKQLQAINKGVETQKKNTMESADPKNVDAVLQLGTEVIGAIGQQRQASGKAAARQARLAACGRKPLLGITKKQKKRKEEYAKCAQQAIADVQAGERSADVPPPPSDEGGSNTMLYVGIGLGVVVLGVVGFILYKKFGK